MPEHTNRYFESQINSLILLSSGRISISMPRKHFTTSMDEDLLKAIKKLAIDLNCTVNDLLEEGVKYLLKKYQKKSKK
jgi:hypothetical protein